MNGGRRYHYYDHNGYCYQYDCCFTIVTITTIAIIVVIATMTSIVTLTDFCDKTFHERRRHIGR